MDRKAIKREADRMRRHLWTFPPLSQERREALEEAKRLFREAGYPDVADRLDRGYRQAERVAANK